MVDRPDLLSGTVSARRVGFSRCPAGFIIPTGKVGPHFKSDALGSRIERYLALWLRKGRHHDDRCERPPAEAHPSPAIQEGRQADTRRLAAGPNGTAGERGGAHSA